MSDETKFPSQLAERFQVRMPDGLRDRIAEAAKANNRSMNAEIVAVLEERFPEPRPLAELLDSIEKMIDLYKSERVMNMREEILRELERMEQEVRKRIGTNS